MVLRVVVLLRRSIDQVNLVDMCFEIEISLIEVLMNIMVDESKKLMWFK